ncbi:MAG: TfuA domain-containing protein [Hyphomicrobiales bacterium]|nr:TfuA domain-containing protein [Hyphomicrobiales bacterium]
MIGLVDGYFETVPSVWHKEILWALSQGIQVYGSSSVGALRAVELAPFGMRGVGKVFEDFRDGILQDDDEVALLHAPEELDYAPLSEPMVNMRATVEKAAYEGLLNLELSRILLESAKSLFYKERTWDAAAVLSMTKRRYRIDEIRRACEIVKRNLVDQKRKDAQAVCSEIAKAAVNAPDPGLQSFLFSQTVAWSNAFPKKRIAHKTSLIAPYLA